MWTGSPDGQREHRRDAAGLTCSSAAFFCNLRPESVWGNVTGIANKVYAYSVYRLRATASEWRMREGEQTEGRGLRENAVLACEHGRLETDGGGALRAGCGRGETREQGGRAVRRCSKRRERRGVSSALFARVCPSRRPRTAQSTADATPGALGRRRDG